MENPPLSPSVSAGSQPLVAAEPGRHLDAYRTRDLAWTQTVTVRDFFHEKPEVALYLSGGGAPPRAFRRQAQLNAALGVALCLIVVFGPWRFKELFRRVEPSRTVTFTAKPPPLGRSQAPTIARELVSRIDDALAKDNLLGALEAAEQLAAQPEHLAAMRAKPEAWVWLVKVLVNVPVLAAEHADGTERLKLYQRASASFERCARGDPAPVFPLLYYGAVAKFHLLGGLHRDTQAAASASDLAQAERVLQLVGELRNRFGANVAQDPQIGKRLLLLEGWILACRLSENAASKFRSRFDPEARANQERWLRLVALLEQAERELGLATETDLLRLKLWFWETAGSFCRNPFRDEEVTISSWTRRETHIDAMVLTLRKQLNLAP